MERFLKNLLLTFKTRSPSWRVPSLAARPVGVMCLMKIWLPSFIPYSAERNVLKSWQEPQMIPQRKAMGFWPSVGFLLIRVVLMGLFCTSWLGSLLKPDMMGRSWPLRSGVTLRVRRLRLVSVPRWPLFWGPSSSSMLDCETERVGLLLAGIWIVRGLFTVYKMNKTRMVLNRKNVT